MCLCLNYYLLFSVVFVDLLFRFFLPEFRMVWVLKLVKFNWVSIWFRSHVPFRHTCLGYYYYYYCYDYAFSRSYRLTVSLCCCCCCCCIWMVWYLFSCAFSFDRTDVWYELYCCCFLLLWFFLFASSLYCCCYRCSFLSLTSYVCKCNNTIAYTHIDVILCTTVSLLNTRRFLMIQFAVCSSHPDNILLLFFSFCKLLLRALLLR